MTMCSILAAGLLLLTFDDADYSGWLKHLPLFARYDAHATFFPCGNFGTNELARLKAIAAAGHTVGLHTVHHRSADVAFKEEGCSAFWRDEVAPELKAARDAGLELRHLAYPNNRHSPETDAFLAENGFERFRAGVKGGFRYNTNGTSVVSLDRAFFPVADLPHHRVIEGIGVGSYYMTDIDDICRGIRRAAERDEVFALYSHDISAKPGKVGMRTEWLEKILATARACNVPVRGFGELGPVAPRPADGPMTVYLTFDDGIKDHLLIAAGELEKRGWRGIFCIVADWIGREGKLTWDDVRELQRRGHVIANHTRTHKSLGSLCRCGKAEEARADILEGAEAIERETGVRPKLLCLPGTNGDAEVTRMVRQAGMTTMLVPRNCFGEWKKDVGKTIDSLRANGVRRIDFLVHGVCRDGGGWKPFATREDFVKYLDGVQAAERSGKIVVSSVYRVDDKMGSAVLQAAIDRCAAAGGGVVTADPGRTTMAGVLTLRSNVTLKLRDDSEIFFPDDPALYGRTPALVYAEGATNVAIVGKGVIRAQGGRWHREVYPAKGWRPRFFQFRRCEGVRLEDFRVRGSPMWTLHLLMSKKIVMRGLDVFARGGNTDGVDVDSSQDVLIENCRLDQGDDGFVMKSGKNEEGRRRAMPTKNVTIRNCTVVNAHTLLGIGSELSGGIENVHLENCTVEGKVWKVLYVKSSRARGGWARDISVRNVTCERAKVCVFGIRTDYTDTSYSAESTNQSFLTPMEDIVMENVTVDHGWRMCEIDGFEELPPKGVVLRNVTLKHATRGESEIRNAGDLRQENVAADMGPFSVWCDEPDAKYACGEPALFTVVAHTNAGVATVRLDNFGKGVLEERTVDFAKTPRLELKGSRDIPGFLLLTVRLGRDTKRCGASFGRRQISGGAGKPADFESFWREAIAKYDREVPVDVKLERSGLLSTNGCDVFRVELSDPFGRTVGGYLKEPKDLSGGPFPVLVNIPGAGPCIGAPIWERADYVELMMNVHYWKAVDGAAKRGLEHTALQGAEDKAWLEKYPVASNRRYCVCGIAASREEYYYYGAILAIRRAVQWLRTRPEVDPDRFVYWGGSQGGGMGLALMALDGRFRRGAVLVPALTAHHCHKIDGRQEGWPNLLLSQLPENEAAASRNAPYFDGVNFASMIRHPILFTASYTDTVAPPHAAYAAYNACPAKEKYIMDVVGFGHEGSRVESGEARRWLLNEDHEYAIPIANMTCPWSPWR